MGTNQQHQSHNAMNETKDLSRREAIALLAARLKRVSLDDIARQAQPNPLHPQHGAHHHG